MDALLEVLSKHKNERHKVVQGMEYFKIKCKRMRYAEFRAQELCVSNRVVDASCKHAIGSRLRGHTQG